jgi:GNAT superfamily N-acetyltransferase
MPIDPVLAHARGLWEELARVPVSFDPAGSVAVVVSPESWMCPPGWVGVVLLDGSAIVAAPNRAAAAQIEAAFSGLAVEALVDTETVGALLPVADVLGPATLGYLGEHDFRPAQVELQVEELAVGDPELRRLEKSAGEDDAGEAGLDEITSPVFVIRTNGQVVAASGYRLWPQRTAHLSVLTAPGWRGQGLGRTAASHAVGHALTAGLLPQWRARPAESRRVAAALGFRELGAQLSFKLA